MLGIIERQVEHLSHIVDDCSTSAELPRQNPAAKSNCGFQRHRGRGFASVPAVARRSRHTVESQLATKLYVSADATRISQLSSTSSTMPQYTPSGGHISISVKRDTTMRYSGSATRVWVLRRNCCRKSLICSCRAIGLSIAAKAAWASPYHRQADRGHARGSVVASSDGPGQGSEFSVRLPLHLCRRQLRRGAGRAAFACIESAIARGRRPP